MNIIGLVGPIACGKGVVADYLKKQGYSSISLSSLLHDELKKRGVTSFTRTTLQDLGDELRRKEGDGVLARRAIKLFGRPQGSPLLTTNYHLQPTPYPLPPKLLIEGIRNPGEIEYLRSIPGFFLIAVDASAETRFQRILQRGKPWDPKDWESFQKVDGRDTEDKGNASGQQVRRCMDLADVRIENEEGVEEVYTKLSKIMSP